MSKKNRNRSEIEENGLEEGYSEDQQNFAEEQMNALSDAQAEGEDAQYASSESGEKSGIDMNAIVDSIPTGPNGLAAMISAKDGNSQINNREGVAYKATFRCKEYYTLDMAKAGASLPNTVRIPTEFIMTKYSDKERVKNNPESFYFIESTKPGCHKPEEYLEINPLSKKTAKEIVENYFDILDGEIYLTLQDVRSGKTQVHQALNNLMTKFAIKERTDLLTRLKEKFNFSISLTPAMRNAAGKDIIG